MKGKKLVALVVTVLMIVAFSAGISAAPAFSDLDGHWAKDSVTGMAEKGIVSGYPDGTFRPNNTVTRAEFAKMLYLTSGGGEETSSLENPFKDVKADWYYDAVVALYNDGVIKGTSETEFSPNAEINREQMVTLIDRAAKTYGCFALSPDKEKTLDDFSDSGAISDYAKESCAYAYQTGLINGIDGAFAPKGSASRAQVAVILDRALSAEKVLPLKIEQEDWVDAKQYVKLSTGITMAYVEMGQAEGDPVILLHGHTDSSRTWSMTAQELAKDFHLYILDQRGSGDTDAPDNRAYSTLLFANDVNAFMDAVGLEKAHIVGHSMGSHIAQAFAILFPEKVDKMILMGSAYVTNSESYKYARESYSAGDFDPTDEEFLNYWDYVTPGCWDGASYKEDAEEMLEYIKRDTSVIDIRAFVNPPTGSMLTSLVNGYDQITAPTLLMCGESDADNQAELSKALGENYRGIIVYPGHNHSIQWEIPYEVGEDIAKYLKGEENDKIAPAYVKELPKEISQEDWNDSKQFAQLSTGINMAYVEMGDASGEPVVLVHGGGADTSRTFSLAAPYFAKAGFHVFCIDRKANGDTVGPAVADYDCYSEASDLAAFIDAMGFEKANIVGHSMGSIVCQCFLVLYPDKIDKIAFYPSMHWTVSEYVPTTEADYDDEYYEYWIYNEIPEEERTEEFKNFLEWEIYDAKRASVEDMNNMARGSANTDTSKSFQNIETEYLLLWGTLDTPFPMGVENPQLALGNILLAGENSKFITYEGVGHNIQWEIPETLANDLIAYFNDQTPPSGYTDKEAFIESGVLQPEN